MSCQEFRSRLHPYIDGELGVNETVVADAHSEECPRCRALAEGERRFRQLLRRQPRESAPPEFRSRVVAEVRRADRRAALRPWLIAPLAAAAAALVVAVALPAFRPASTPVISQFVDKHITYSQIERPAEFNSTDPDEVTQWFIQRAGLRVTVPDYSAAGIRLVGARVAQVDDRRAAYVLYEKGRVLLSVFMASSAGRRADLGGAWLSYRGQGYVKREHKGYHTVSWTDGQTVYGLVSMLDWDALLECADRLRQARARSASL